MLINDTSNKSIWKKAWVLFSCLPFYFLSLCHSQCNCHENELLICFPKEFLMPRRPDSRNTMVVVWSTNNFPGLHCISKALFHQALIMWKMSLSKVSLLFFSHKDVRWRELEFPNMLIRVSVNSDPSSTVLESSFSKLEMSCAWATQVCLWVRMQYVFKLKVEYRIMSYAIQSNKSCMYNLLTPLSQCCPWFHKTKMTPVV